MRPQRRHRGLSTMGALALTALVPFVAVAQSSLDRRWERVLKGVTIKNRLGKQLNLGLHFTDHRGKKVTLKRYFDGKKPVILTLNYYRCTTLCSVQLRSFIKTMKRFDWKIGDKYRVLTVSIDHREGVDLAAGKRKSFLEDYGRGEVDWSFLVGDKGMIKALADAVGFRFRYEPRHDQYIHVPAIFFLDPRGKLTRFLHGLKYSVRDVKFSLIDASKGKLGSVIDRFFLSCFHFDPNKGKYSAFAFGIMRIFALLTAVLMLTVLIVLKVRERTHWRKGKVS